MTEAPTSNDPPPSTSSAPPSNSNSRPSATRGLDRAVERIRNANLPPAPYIASVDGSIYSGRAVGPQWTRDSPFAPEEGHLQYQTWLFRDTSNSLLRLRAAHEDDEWRTQRAMQANGATIPPAGAKSGASTPLNAATGAKKKISLGDYTSRKEAGAGSQATTPTSHAQAGDLRKETLKRELGVTTDQKPPGNGEPERSDASGANPPKIAQPTIPDANLKEETSGSQNKIPDPELETTPATHASKRPLPDADNDNDAESFKSPAKKLRTTPPPSTASQNKIVDSKAEMNPNSGASKRPLPDAENDNDPEASKSPAKKSRTTPPPSHASQNKIPDSKSETKSDSGASKRPLPDSADNDDPESSKLPAKKTRTTPPPSHVPRPSEDGQAKTPATLVSTAPGTESSPPVAVSQSAAAQPISAAQPAAPSAPSLPNPESTTASSAYAKKSSADTTKNSVDGAHSTHQHSSVKREAPQEVKIKHENTSAPVKKQLETPGPREHSKIEKLSLSSKEKGLCSWLPKASSEEQEDQSSWMPSGTAWKKENRTPPLLTSLARDGSSRIKKSSSSTDSATVPDKHSKSTAPSDVARNQGLAKKPTGKGPGSSSPHPLESRSSRPLDKSKDTKTKVPKQVDTKPSNQSSNVVSKPQNAQEPINGALKAPKMVKVTSSGKSTFFKNFETDKKNASARPLSSIPSRKEDQEKLIVKLKYGRARVKDVERILQLKPMPRKAPMSSANFEQSQINASAASQHNHSRTNSIEQKPTIQKEEEPNLHVTTASRKRSQDDDVSPPQSAEKRRKTEPHPPHGQAQQSPTKDPPAKLTQQISPQSSKTANRTSQSTPIQDIAVVSPDSSAPAEGAGRRKSATSDAGNDIPAEAWPAEYRRLYKTARDLKRKHVEDFNRLAGSKTVDAKAKKINAVEGVESILAFMRAFAYRDLYVHEARWSMQSWDSMLPWAGQVLRSCESLTDLRGLTSMLRHACSVELGAAFTRVNLAEYSPPPHDTTLPRVLENFRQMQRFAADSARLLPRAVMAENYPGAYEECSLLPLLGTSPARAIKVGYKFLTEWTSQEGISWTPQLDDGMLG